MVGATSSEVIVWIVNVTCAVLYIFTRRYLSVTFQTFALIGSLLFSSTVCAAVAGSGVTGKLSFRTTGGTKPEREWGIGERRFYWKKVENRSNGDGCFPGDVTLHDR